MAGSVQVDRNPQRLQRRPALVVVKGLEVHRHPPAPGLDARQTPTGEAPRILLGEHGVPLRAKRTPASCDVAQLGEERGGGIVVLDERHPPREVGLLTFERSDRPVDHGGVRIG